MGVAFREEASLLVRNSAVHSNDTQRRASASTQVHVFRKQTCRIAISDNSSTVSFASGNVHVYLGEKMCVHLEAELPETITWHIYSLHHLCRKGG